MGRTGADFISKLNDLYGFDLEDDEALDAINEAHTEFCVRSEWSKPSASIGPTVADQANYSLPADCARLLRVYFNGNFKAHLASEDDVKAIQAGTIYYRVPNGSILYWEDDDEIALYPVPSESGLALRVRYVARPTAIESGTEPVTPPEYDRALLRYAAAITYSQMDDDEEQAAPHELYFERKVEEARRFRNSRKGRGPVLMKIRGVNA